MQRIKINAISLIVLAVLLTVVWSKVRISVHIWLTPMQALVGLSVVVIVLILAVDHVINRTR